MKKHNGLYPRGRAAHIALRILCPFILQIGRTGKKIKSLAENERRITAGFLAFCMVLTILPLGILPARAESVASPNTIVVDGSKYALTARDLFYAIITANDGDTIDIRGNVNIDDMVGVIKSVTITSSTGSSLIRDAGFTSGSMLFVQSGVTLTLKKITLNGNNVEGSSAIHLSAAHLIMEDQTVIKNCNAGTYLGGAVYAPDNGTTITMNDSTISGSSATHGGGVYMDSGTITMNDSTISGNTASYGGGIFLASGSANITGGSIAGNTAKYGGGVHNSGNFTMIKSIISGNEADYGGGAYNYNGTFIMIDSTISDNTATVGGGIFTESGSHISMTGGLITHNTSSSTPGGGVYFYSGTFNVSGSACVTDNTAGTVPSNVYLKGGTSVLVAGDFTGAIGITKEDLIGTAVIGNITADNKDQFFIDCMVKYGKYYDTVFIDNRIDIQEVTDKVQTVSAFSELTAAVANSASKPYIDVQANIALVGTIDISDSKQLTIFSSNGSAITRLFSFQMHMLWLSGLGTKLTLREIRLDGHSNYAILNAIYNTDTAKLVLNPGAVIQNNNIKQTSTSPDYLNGGGVFNSNSVIIMNGGAISGNRASLHGGGVYNNGTFTMNGGTISDNTATNNSGGGVFNGGTFTMRSGIISGNTATNNNGGGVQNNGTFSMNGGSISNNTASGIYGIGNGGGVLNNGTFTMCDGNISDNTANTIGGGVYSSNSGTFIMNDGAISNNTARDGYGGGVYSEGAFAMNGGGISGNTTSNDGGGVYNEGIFTINGGTISGNNARLGGGVLNYNTFTMSGGIINYNLAIYGGGVYNGASFTMSDGTISCNNVTFRGGGVYTHGTFTMSGGGISGNTANNTTRDGDGGGVYNEGAFTITGGAISSNKANNSGGGVYIGLYAPLSATFSMIGGTISNNTAYYGGGVFNNNASIFTMSGGDISRNSASHSGGGVRNNGIFTMSDSSIYGNSAYYSGGGVYNYDGTFTMNSGTISENESTNHNGGGIYNQGPFTMNGGNLSGNAAHFGGGIYNVSTFAMDSGNISDNTASYDGGGVGNAGTFTMVGGAISNNTAKAISGNGGGGGVHNNGTFNIQGASTITNNRKGANESAPINNVFLLTGKTITVTGALSGEVGVNMQTYGTAAVGSTTPAYTVTQNDKNCLIPDMSGYVSHLDSANNSIQILLLPVMAPLSAPARVTAGNKLLATAPIVTDNGFVTENHRFEIKKPGQSYVTFDPQNTVLDISYNGSYLRYLAEYTNDTTKTIYSNEVPVNVIKTAPALMVGVSPDNPATYGNEVALTATFSGAYIPSGTVQFKVGGVNLGAPVVISSGKAVYCYTPNASDTAYSYAAVYSGDANNEPAASAITSYTVNKANQSVLAVVSDSSITFGDTYVASASGGSSGGAVSFQIIGGTGEGSFNGNVLTVTKAGTIIYTAKMSGGSNYNDVISSAFTLTVNKANSSISINNDKTVVYSKNEVTYATSDVTKSGSSGTIMFNYYSDIPCTNEIPAPINVGTYYVKATVAADDNYNSATSASAKIIINPKPVSIIGVTVNDKSYDGNNTATISSSGTLNGVIDGDIVDLKSGTCTFNSINAGNGIALTASGFGIEGASVNNYILTSQPAMLNANITTVALSVSVEKVTIKTGQPIPSLAVLVTGFVNGESETGISGFVKPGASVSGEYDTTVQSLSKFNVTYSSGNATNNYTFQYNNVAQIEIQSVYITDADYSADKDLTKWQKGDIKITPKNEYTGISTDKTNWAASLSLSVEGDNSVAFYLKKPDGTITENKTINYKVDNTAPSGEITVKENRFKSFINFISFGVFCKNTVDVTISGVDNLTNYTIEYMVCEDTDTTGHSYQSYSGTFSLSSKGTHVVFAKITDEVGNETIIRTDGVIVYQDSTADTDKVTYEKLSSADKSATVNLNGNTIDSVMVADTLLTSSQYTVNGNAITLKGDYLETLSAGNHTVTVSFNPQGVEYDPSNSDGDITYNGDAPATTTFIIEVVRKELTVNELLFTPPQNLIYDGSNKTALVTAKTGIIGIGTVTVSYYHGDEELSFAPVNVGIYTVKVDITDGENYSSVSGLTVGSFTIVNADQPVPTTPSPSDPTTFANNDGKISGLDSSMEYQKQGDIGWNDIIGTELTGLSDGVYLVRYAAKANYNESEAKVIAVAKFEGTKEAVPEAEFNAIARTLSNTQSNQKYRIGEHEWSDITSDLSTIVTQACVIEIYMPGDGIYTLDSDIQTIMVAKATKPNVTVSNESFAGKNDGKLSGVDETMEYKAENGGWMAVDGDIIENLAPGKYFVRVKAAQSVLESDFVEITLAAGDDEFKYRTISDIKNRVSVSGSMTDGVALNISSISKGNKNFDSLIKLIDTARNTVADAFEVAITGGRYQGKLIISFAIGAEYNDKALTICHQKSDGSTEILTTMCKDGKATVTVDELSPFLITVANNASDNSGIPVTGNNDNQAPWIVVFLAFGIVLLSAVNQKKNRRIAGK
ncbi:MAG: YDG domain-containing protein [Oscillospiraceae bacterium]|nr:YDG domain-containing protein [Oscillospiraceae bacterium]MDD4413173.1 YDG domain-containing protein [Oscillospiraceae bacterium]